ncbi:class I adenylate-forming enzyme family protein [Camelimonas abortus]|uniref:Class I adenylate-forming enzyme family protein n=1 Tax=Camelimonas abortus TaxID=1017184 RepID=A0ABV7LBY5_9HYPH
MAADTTATPEGFAMSAAEAERLLTAPDAQFAWETIDIRGVPTRVWKNAPPNLRVVLEATEAFGDLPCIVFEDERLTYAGHLNAVRSLATALVQRFGVKKGDRVAIAMRNYPEWVITFWAAVAIGAIATPLNAWMTADELVYCLKDSGAAVLAADGERIDRIRDRLGEIPARAVIGTRPEQPFPPGVIPWDAVVTATPGATLPPADIAPDDDATIFYTSGTTGMPKGVLGTHRNICSNLVTLAYGRTRALMMAGQPVPDPATAPKKSFLLPVPLFHVTGCHSALVPTFLAGNKLVLMYKWDARRGLELIEREKVNGFTGVPAIAWQVIEHPDFGKFDLSSLEAVSYGGAPAPAELPKLVKATFPLASAGNGYGLTETSSVTAQNQGLEYLRKPDSVGRPVPVCEIRVVDHDGRDVPAGEIGELWIRGPNVVKGYWNRPEETAKTFTGGWLHSGDLVRVDEEGFIYILDRAKDMVIRGGENIYCTEVENALYSHPAVMDAAVFGLPHRVLGEEVAAVVQLKPGHSATEQELIAHAAQRLAAYKTPVRIDVRTEPLPRNANGKVLKRELKAQLAG